MASIIFLSLSVVSFI